MAPTNISSRVSAQFHALFGMIVLLADYDREVRGEPAAASILGNRGVLRGAQAGTIVSVVIIGVIALVGILVASKFAEWCPESGQLAQTCQSVSLGIGTGLSEAVGPLPLLVFLILLFIATGSRLKSYE